MTMRTWLLGSVMFGSAAVWAAVSSDVSPYTVVSVGALVGAAGACSLVAWLTDRGARRTRVVDIRPREQRHDVEAAGLDVARLEVTGLEVSGVDTGVRLETETDAAARQAVSADRQTTDGW
ncbi:hypothetical protein ACPEEZ_09265 [Frigoribacterium sp. 2-23]|uniref:hypothetical protein n=1 Tax=Frigoribacterium sp. 2-23 TaxID=3415006 RepID=UPI003C6EAB01